MSDTENAQTLDFVVAALRAGRVSRLAGGGSGGGAKRTVGLALWLLAGPALELVEGAVSATKCRPNHE